MRYDVAQIEKRRMEKGWSRRALAEKAGVSPSVISLVERGLSARPETMQKIADALGLNLRRLVIDDESEKATA